MRLEKVLKEMQKRQLTHLIISDPSSIDYLINYKNNPGERMYLLLLSSDGHHKLFMNNLFYLDHEIDIEQVWYSDTDNYLQLLADE
ncbi:aminopeptidase P family N-terminal domain-containing protein, partial [Faecalibacillus intestinalis]